jgi:rhodanese-related sulfurtransferase
MAENVAIFSQNSKLFCQSGGNYLYLSFEVYSTIINHSAKGKNVKLSSIVPGYALRQALLLLLAAAVLGLAANRLNPHGVAIGMTDSPPAIGGVAWDDGEATDSPRMITLAQLRELSRRQPPLLIDARSHQEYLAGHLPGAISLPFEEWLAQIDRVRSLPRERWLVLYCDGGSCELSHHLAQELLTQGFRKVAVYAGGIEEWQLTRELERGEESRE